MNDIENSIYNIQRKVIDNRHLKMTEVLKYLLSRDDIHSLDVAVGYFYISGLTLLKNEFAKFMDEKNGQFRILMGNETNRSTVNVLNNDESFIEELKKKIANDTNNVDDIDFLERVHEWIKAGRIKVQVYTGNANYFHAKSYLFANSIDSDRGTAIVGSSNFSRNGLEGNTELNVLSEDNYYALHRWYSDLWFSKETSEFSPELIHIISSKLPTMVKENAREYIAVSQTYYDFANLFSKPYAKLDSDQKWARSLYPHQRTGIVSMKDKLDSFGTGVLADGVGLGKTRTAAGIIRLYRESATPTKILIVADAKLKSQWIDELKTVGVEPNDYDYMTRDNFARQSYSDIEKMRYTLVVVDEAHLGFKNNNTQAYNKMRALREANPNSKGLMMTATPWNNRREDVINIGMLFMNPNQVPNDREYKQYILLGGLTNKVVKKMANDNKAFGQFWEDIYLQRTRKTYGGKGAKFPDREFPVVDIPYEPNKNKIFSENFEKISDLKFPYMDPIKYLNSERESLGANQLKLLLLKRADSSWIAYEDSLLRIEKNIKKLQDNLKVVHSYTGKEFLRRYKNYLIGAYEIFQYQEKNKLIKFDEKDLFSLNYNADVELSNSDHDIRSKIRKRQYIEKLESQINDIDLKSAKKAVEMMTNDADSDLETLKQLVNELRTAYSKIDEKLNTVIDQVSKELQLNHKIIIITQFSDTAEYYYKRIYNHFNSETIRLNMGLVTGGQNGRIKINNAESTKKDVLDHFSPKSKGKIEILRQHEDLKLIVGTDTISTGQNLQDAVTLMNLDLPYNPMILEQRIGRIDRPRKNDDGKRKIFIYTFPVYSSIDSQLKMAKRLGTKMEGVLEDTEFDNVVLPEYRHYLENAKRQDVNAMQSMVDETSDKYIHERSIESETHSQQYKEANERLYDFKINGYTKFENPLISNFSFSNAPGNSIIVANLIFKDVNGAPLSHRNIIVDTTKEEISTIINAEQAIRTAIPKDLKNTKRLSLSKAQLIVKKNKNIAMKVALSFIDEYNKEQNIITSNRSQLMDKVSQKAAANIRESAQTDKELVKSSISKIGMQPIQLADLMKYIQTIQKDDPLYELVKIIANDIGYFWTHIKDYQEELSPDVIAHANNVGKQRHTINLRKADKNQSELNILIGNISVSEYTD